MPSRSYRMPQGMRPATLEERNLFYSEEFNFDGVKRWVARRKNPLFAAKIGKVTNIYKREFKDDYKDTILLTQTPLQELRESLLYHLPESVYYDRNVYRDPLGCEGCLGRHKDPFSCDNFLGQELAYDLDPENIWCKNCGSLDERMERGEMYSFCLSCFGEVRRQALDLLEMLKNDFKEIKPVFSGRGFHLHVLDGKAFAMTREERAELSQQILDAGIEHDEWVANGSSRLIRLPHSLHGVVSRVVTPLTARELRRFDPVKDCKPSFL